MLDQNRMLNREEQNKAAHTSTVGMIAYQLQRAFRAYPDAEGQSIIEKIFVWICGKSLQAAIDDRDDRTVNTNGVSKSESAFWSEEQGMTKIDELLEAGEEVDRFFSAMRRLHRTVLCKRIGVFRNSGSNLKKKKFCTRMKNAHI